MRSDIQVPLPTGWPNRIRSAVNHVISLAHFSLTFVRSVAANNINARIRLKTENSRLRQEITVLIEEARIKDSRVERIPAQRRPHYPPIERMAIREVRAARGWSLYQTARRFLVTPATIASWTQRLDEEGPGALVQIREPVNRFPDFARYIVQRLKVLCPTMGKVKIAQVLCRAGLHLSSSSVGTNVAGPAEIEAEIGTGSHRSGRDRQAAESRLARGSQRGSNCLWLLDRLAAVGCAAALARLRPTRLWNCAPSSLSIAGSFALWSPFSFLEPAHRRSASRLPACFLAEPDPMLNRGQFGRIATSGGNVLNFNVDVYLKAMLGISDRVSDLNFSVGKPPQVELDGQLRPVNFPGLQKLSPFQTEQIAMQLMQGNRDVINALVRTGSTDCSYAIPGRKRFRINIFQQRGTYAIVLRVIATEIPTVEQLGLPEEINNVGALKNGIVLVTGPTGSGKSTTLAAIIDKINREKPYHIVTIEDPVEYAHPHKVATVNQREVGSDTGSFGLALRAALRQAPKVILIGEMRDVETIEIAMEAAETGHLVLSTLHTIDASKTIDRIIGVFPKDQEPQIRTRLAQSFRYIISQRLMPKIGGGRTAALEILKSSMRTREYVTQGEGEGKSLVDAMRDGSDDGMQEFDCVLQTMVERGLITTQSALAHATNQNNLRLMLTDASQAAPTTENDIIMLASDRDTSGV